MSAGNMVYVTVLVPDDLIEPLLAAHLAAIDMQSPRSLAGRRLTVLRVARFLGSPVSDASTDDIAAWRTEMTHRERPLKKSSLATALTHLSCYLDWLVRQGYRADNPVDRVERPRHAFPQDPHPITTENLIRARTHADPVMHAWLGLGAFCGLRCMEIAGIRREDISQGRLEIHGKGGRHRTVKLPSSIESELQGPDCQPTGHLWINGSGQPFTATQVSRRINAYLRRLGIPSTAHSCRHYFATELLRSVGDITKVRDALGHASVSTTERYTKVIGDKTTDDAIERLSHVAA